MTTTHQDSVRAYYAEHEELRRARKDPISLPIEKKKKDIHNRYYMYYMNAHVDYIKLAIIGAISHGETSCVIYDENTLETGLSAADLVAIFTHGVGGAPPIESLFTKKLGTEEYRIRCHRTTYSKFIGDTTVLVQFVLEWHAPSSTITSS